MRPVRGGVLTTLLLILTGCVIAGLLTWFFYCPCERTPGGYLLGEEAGAPVADWSFANDMDTVPLCQIQVDTGLLPHSINLNCMADNGALFLSCADCDGKRWSTAALENPAARLRAAGVVYPVTLTRVTDPATLDRAWAARAAKRGQPSNTPREDGWWSFRVESR